MSDLEHFKELHAEKMAGMQKALELQAREYERRLEGLNHEAARILESQQKSISVEKFDGAVGQVNTRIDSIQKSFDEKYAELSKRVYIITGMLVTVEILMKLFFKQ